MLNDRIEIFNALIHELDSLNMDKFKSLLDDYYDNFVSFCLYVKTHPDGIVSVSCSMTSDGVEFTTIDKEGKVEVYNIDK